MNDAGEVSLVSGMIFTHRKMDGKIAPSLRFPLTSRPMPMTFFTPVPR
jgi:hypothetical protein